MLGLVPVVAAAEEEVLRQGDPLVDGEPVADEEHEVLEPVLEVVVARNGDGHVDASAQERPHEARHSLCASRQYLHRQRN